ncbi:hypothetical protein Tco_1516563 [Tanacetum coccineum]
MLKNLALIAKYFQKIYKPTNNNLKTSSNSRNKNVDTSLRYKNENQTGQFRNHRTVTIAGARETIGSQVKDSMYHKEKMLLCKQAEKGVPLQEVPTPDSGTDTEPLEKVQNDAGYNVFANVRQHSEQPESTSNTCLVEKDDSNVTSDSPDLCDNDIQTDQNAEDRIELVDQAWEKHSHDHFRTPTAHDIEILIKTCLMLCHKKTEGMIVFTICSELRQEMHDDLKYVESLEKEIDELESDKAEFSNMYDILLQECVSNDVMCSYLHLLSDLDAHTELQCLYLHKVKECECLAQKLSKQTETVSKEVYTELL